MLTVKKDDFDENIDDIMKSINKMLDKEEEKNKKEKIQTNQKIENKN